MWRNAFDRILARGDEPPPLPDPPPGPDRDEEPLGDEDLEELDDEPQPIDFEVR